MPSRAEVSTTSRTESMPARWPSTRGRWRCAAQRPLPSMMMATCAGQLLEVDLARQRLVGRSRRNRTPGAAQATCRCPSVANVRFYYQYRHQLGRTRRRPGTARAAGAVGPACARSPRRQHLAPSTPDGAGRGPPRPACRRWSAPCGAGNRLPDTSYVMSRVGRPAATARHARREAPSRSVVVRVAAGGLERREVVAPLEAARGRGHRVDVERRRRHVPGVRALERAEHVGRSRCGSDRSSGARRSARGTSSGTTSTASSTRTAGGSRALSARTTRVGVDRRARSVTRATCPSACTPASVRPAPVTVDRRGRRARASASSSSPWIGRARGLTLPADEPGAVVGEGQLEASACVETALSGMLRR